LVSSFEYMWNVYTAWYIFQNHGVFRFFYEDLVDFVQNFTISRQKLAVAEILVFDRQNRRNCRTKLKDINGNNRVIVKNLKFTVTFVFSPRNIFLIRCEVSNRTVTCLSWNAVHPKLIDSVAFCHKMTFQLFAIYGHTVFFVIRKKVWRYHFWVKGKGVRAVKFSFALKS